MGFIGKLHSMGKSPPDSVSDSTWDELMQWREQLVKNGLRAMLIIGVMAVSAGSYYAYKSGSPWVVPLYLLAYFCLMLVALVPQIPYKVRAGTLVGLVYLLGIIDLIESGRGGDGRVFLLAVPVLAVLFFGRLEGFSALVLNLLTMALFAWLFTSEKILIPVSRQANFTDPFAWISNTIVLLMLGTFLVSSLSFIVPRLIASLTRSRRLLKRLDEAHKELREHSEQLTSSHRLLSERAKALEVTAALAQDATSIHQLQAILERVVTLISKRFDFYHVSIFLVGNNGEQAILRAASSEGGRRMIKNGYRLAVGGTGIVGYVTGQGKPKVVLNVEHDPVFLFNPELPNTRSEMTVPLRVRGQVIGALDVQSTAAQAFTEDDITMMQTIADQLAMVISNLRLYNQAQEKLESERRVYRDLSEKAWNEVPHTRSDLAYRYHHGDVTRFSGSIENFAQVGETKEAKLTLELPVSIRGQIIGTFVAKKAANTGDWSQEEVDLLNSLIEQLSIALESARLYHETQQRALREQLVTEISTKMRASNDPDVILETAVKELRYALRSEHIKVLFHPKEAQENSSPNGSRQP